MNRLAQIISKHFAIQPRITQPLLLQWHSRRSRTTGIRLRPSAVKEPPSGSRPRSTSAVVLRHVHISLQRLRVAPSGRGRRERDVLLERLLRRVLGPVVRVVRVRRMVLALLSCVVVLRENSCGVDPTRRCGVEARHILASERGTAAAHLGWLLEDLSGC
jgi:hypothetical protein